jgi:Ser/Thr protein kinase RdoA (MazF antagonist)
MPKRPSPPQPALLSSWDIYKVAAKQTWLGTVEATDADAAIAAATKEFKTDARRLIATRRRAIS